MKKFNNISASLLGHKRLKKLKSQKNKSSYRIGKNGKGAEQTPDAQLISAYIVRIP